MPIHRLAMSALLCCNLCNRIGLTCQILATELDELYSSVQCPLRCNPCNRTFSSVQCIICSAILLQGLHLRREDIAHWSKVHPFLLQGLQLSSVQCPLCSAAILATELDELFKSLQQNWMNFSCCYRHEYSPLRASQCGIKSLDLKQCPSC